MHHRYERTNIPIEIVRTLVVIAETGSFSKAGRKLGLSQPAISAQVKRLQFLVSGPMFNRVPGGVSLTALGELVLAHARKLLAANDQILLLGGAVVHEPQPLRLGLSTLFVDEFCKVGSASKITRCWLDWVKMVEIMRWPKLSYSALSMVAEVTPKRAAVSRSTLT